MLVRPETIQSVGSLQLSAGREGGCEAACHAMREIFNEDECQGVLLVNAFNSLTRKTSLLNMRYLSPEFMSTSLTLIDNHASCSCQMVLISRHTKGLHRVIGPTLGYFSNPSKTWLVDRKNISQKLKRGLKVQVSN